MWWIPMAAGAALGGIAGAAEKSQQEDQRKDDILINAGRIQMSPWLQVPLKQETQVTASPWSSALSGVGYGTMLAQGLKMFPGQQDPQKLEVGAPGEFSSPAEAQGAYSADPYGQQQYEADQLGIPGPRRNPWYRGQQ